MTNRRKFLLSAAGAAAAAAVASTGWAPTAAAGEKAGTRNYIIGDSIMDGGWFEPNEDLHSPVARLNLRLLQEGREQMVNLSAGGMTVRAPYYDNPVPLAVDYVRANLPSDARIVVLALGANDVGSHRLAAETWWPDAPAGDGRYIDYWKYAYIELWATVKAVVAPNGGRVLIQAVLPVCAGEDCTAPLPTIPVWGQLSRTTVPRSRVAESTARINHMNEWLKAMWPGDFYDVGSALDRNAAGVGAARYYWDGLHPNQWGSLRVGEKIPRGMVSG